MERHRKLPIQPQQYEIGIFLGKNWHLPISGRVDPITGKQDIHLSVESKKTALAAGEMYTRGLIKKILFETGHTAGLDENGNPLPTEAGEMEKFTRRFYPHIPKSAIRRDEESFDTAGNAEKTNTLLSEDEKSNFTLITVWYHRPRAWLTFKNYGLKPAKTFSSEQILRNRTTGRVATLHPEKRRERQSPYKHFAWKNFWKKNIFQRRNAQVAKFALKNAILEPVITTLIATVDQKGTKIVRPITQGTRHRQNDA